MRRTEGRRYAQSNGNRYRKGIRTETEARVVETEVKNRAECTNIRPLITSTNNTSTKKEKKVNISRNETKQMDSE
jgi:hypothetical protein